MKYLKKYNEQMSYLYDLKNSKSLIDKEYEIKIDDCILYMSDNYNTISKNWKVTNDFDDAYYEVIFELDKDFNFKDLEENIKSSINKLDIELNANYSFRIIETHHILDTLMNGHHVKKWIYNKTNINNWESRYNDFIKWIVTYYPTYKPIKLNIILTIS